jgi:hypothetical protein
VFDGEEYDPIPEIEEVPEKEQVKEDTGKQFRLDSF